MEWLTTHVRNKLLAGVLAAVPVVIVVWGAAWVEGQTRPLSRLLGLDIPGLGLLLSLAAVYLLGLAVTSFLGKIVLGLADRLLRHVPGLKLVYTAWKDVLVVSPAKAGMFHEVVLVPGPGGGRIGFTSGRPLPGDPRSICVFLPGIPNPITGRLVLVHRDACLPLKLSAEEALKFLLSTGNYLPTELRGMAADPSAVPAPASGQP